MGSQQTQVSLWGSFLLAGKPRRVAFNDTRAHVSPLALWIINHDTISFNKVEPVSLYLLFTVTTRYKTKQQLYFQFYLSYSVGNPETSWNNWPSRIWFPNHTWYNHRNTARSREILAQAPSSPEVGIRIISYCCFLKTSKFFTWMVPFYPTMKMVWAPKKCGQA